MQALILIELSFLRQIASNQAKTFVRSRATSKTIDRSNATRCCMPERSNASDVGMRSERAHADFCYQHATANVRKRSVDCTAALVDRV